MSDREIMNAKRGLVPNDPKWKTKEKIMALTIWGLVAINIILSFIIF